MLRGLSMKERSFSLRSPTMSVMNNDGKAKKDTGFKRAKTTFSRNDKVSNFRAKTDFTTTASALTSEENDVPDLHGRTSSKLSLAGHLSVRGKISWVNNTQVVSIEANLPNMNDVERSKTMPSQDNETGKTRNVKRSMTTVQFEVNHSSAYEEKMSSHRAAVHPPAPAQETNSGDTSGQVGEKSNSLQTDSVYLVPDGMVHVRGTGDNSCVSSPAGSKRQSQTSNTKIFLGDMPDTDGTLHLSVLNEGSTQSSTHINARVNTMDVISKGNRTNASKESSLRNRKKICLAETDDLGHDNSDFQKEGTPNPSTYSRDIPIVRG